MIKTWHEMVIFAFQICWHCGTVYLKISVFENFQDKCLKLFFFTHLSNFLNLSTSSTNWRIFLFFCLMHLIGSLRTASKIFFQSFWNFFDVFENIFISGNPFNRRAHFHEHLIYFWEDFKLFHFIQILNCHTFFFFTYREISNF